MKFNKIFLPDGTFKLEHIPESSEVIEERRKLHERCLENERKKYKKHEETHKKQREKWLKSKGFKSEYEYRKHIVIINGFKNISEKQNEWIKKKGFNTYSEYIIYIKGFNTYSEYLDDLSIRNNHENYSEYRKAKADNKANIIGFEDRNDLRRYIKHVNGEQMAMNENIECSSYLGVYVTENILSKVFEDVIRMPYGNPGYDFICKNGYKIDVKSTCLRKNDNCSTYHSSFIIKKNKIADYFLCITYDNRNDLNPLYIWLIKSDEIIIGNDMIKRKINDLVHLNISNSIEGLEKFKKYELTDKLEKVKEICNNYKNDNIN